MAWVDNGNNRVREMIICFRCRDNLRVSPRTYDFSSECWLEEDCRRVHVPSYVRATVRATIRATIRAMNRYSEPGERRTNFQTSGSTNQYWQNTHSETIHGGCFHPKALCNILCHKQRANGVSRMRTTNSMLLYRYYLQHVTSGCRCCYCSQTITSQIPITSRSPSRYPSPPSKSHTSSARASSQPHQAESPQSS